MNDYHSIATRSTPLKTISGWATTPPSQVLPGLDLINKIFDSVMVLNVKVAPFPSLLLRDTVLPPSPYFLIVANSVDVRWA